MMDNPLVIALTGSIGMGKSTTAAMFSELGIPVWDADAAVHRMYAPGGAAVEPIAQAFPDAVQGGQVDRGRLRDIVLGDAKALKALEAITHPIVGKDRQSFIADAKAKGAPMVLVDIPLLFETGGNKLVDVVVVASCPPDIQKTRVLARPGMNEQVFTDILAKQTPDAEKRAGADFVVETSTLEAARAQVENIVATLKQGWVKHA